MESLYEQPVVRRVIMEKSKKTPGQYNVQIFIESLMSSKLLPTPVREKKEWKCVLQKSLTAHEEFLQEEVNQYLDFPWGKIEMLFDQVQALLESDHLVINCNYLSGLVNIGSYESGGLIVDYDGHTASFCRCHNGKSCVDVFDCIRLTFSSDKKIVRNFEYAERS